MTKLAYKTEEGKLVLLNTREDECLWSGSWTNGKENNRFEELYLHKCKSGRIVFYICSVTYWQGESNEIKVLGENEVQSWITDYYSLIKQKELDRLAELGFKIEETA